MPQKLHAVNHRHTQHQLLAALSPSAPSSLPPQQTPEMPAHKQSFQHNFLFMYAKQECFIPCQLKSAKTAERQTHASCLLGINRHLNQFSAPLRPSKLHAHCLPVCRQHSRSGTPACRSKHHLLEHSVQQHPHRVQISPVLHVMTTAPLCSSLCYIAHRCCAPAIGTEVKTTALGPASLSWAKKPLWSLSSAMPTTNASG